MSVTRIENDGKLLALIVHRDFSRPGIHFFTPDEFSQQLAHMSHPQGKIIKPHVHKPVTRTSLTSQEVLFLKKGRLRVDFYDEAQAYLESHVLVSGDVILLIQGGHGFEVMEEVEMIEVKQGPYFGDRDRTVFSGVPAEQIKIIEKE